MLLRKAVAGLLLLLGRCPDSWRVVKLLFRVGWVVSLSHLLF